MALGANSVASASPGYSLHRLQRDPAPSLPPPLRMVSASKNVLVIAQHPELESSFSSSTHRSDHGSANGSGQAASHFHGGANVVIADVNTLPNTARLVGELGATNCGPCVRDRATSTRCAAAVETCGMHLGQCRGSSATQDRDTTRHLAMISMQPHRCLWGIQQPAGYERQGAVRAQHRLGAVMSPLPTLGLRAHEQR